ncbi:uncharacterized protein LOC111710052 [Eurytemora carolleeae]|uniref:uncharacterized protein LOC111710052 n=1 Tax=Eurytemora carolleeae TaxID=1294199 RepID=UPI000C761614|nr:uncharacterized protein LOC111710052 [Eurytemora carolleeae]|eukprot:XP_023339835.1 uncharacterized protein LOC111710052 [Eurytemora affinis]
MKINILNFLVKIVKIDPVLSRAVKYDREDLFRRLLELNLRHDSTAYHKSRTFESLLAFQTKHRNTAGGEQTIKTAKSLDITITADFLQEFVNLKKTIEEEKTQNSFTKFSESIKNIFKIK